MNFPKKGEVLNGKKIINANAVLEDDILKYEVILPKGTKTKEVPVTLKKFFAIQVIPSEDNLIVRHHDYTVKPKGGNVAVIGAMHVLPVVRANPSIQQFDEEYSKMEMTKPETYFRKHKCGPINSPQFRAKMFGLVSLMGENYGYGVNNCIYHRRASLIMPKIKITKAVPQAEMMYHTHPRKDEPSLSSPDDYLLYFDLSHSPRSIRHFYTVMADRMDYFYITPKKDSKKNFLKLSEDLIIDELDAEMTDLESKWDKKMPRNGDYQEDLRYCENITRDFVKFLNKKYGKYFTIKYKCYYKVKKNPPEPEIEDLHLNDEVLENSLESIKNRDYSWQPSTKEKAHENYAYWHQMRHLDTIQGSAKTLGIAPQGVHKRTYNRYMNKAFEDTQYNYLDALNILNLAHDIAMSDSKIRDAGGLTSRMKEICEYLEVSEKGTETLQFLEEIIHNGNLFSEEAQTLTGDFYGLALLSSYTIQAIGAIDQVKKGNKDFSTIEYEVYANLKSETQTRFQDFLIGEKDHRGFARGENAPIAQGFVDSFLNPPTVLKKKVEFQHQFPTEAFAYDFDLVKEALDDFNVERYDPKRNFFTKGRFNLRIPTTVGQITMMVTQSTGNAQIFVTGRPNAMEDALDAVTKVGTNLFRYGLPGIDPETYDVQAIDAAQNPQTSQVIAIAGPSGSGKSTTIRNLLKLLPNSKTAPSVTTRNKRKSDKPGEKDFVTVEQFKKENQAGNMVAVQLQKNGNYYGRRRSDFEGADYVIVDVTPKGINAIKNAFPNTFTVYLEPVEDPEFIRKRLLRRGDMSPQEARARASIIPAHIRDSKLIDFDARIKTKQGEFSKIALELQPMIPIRNPSRYTAMVEEVFGKGKQYGEKVGKLKGQAKNVKDKVMQRLKDKTEDKTIVVYGDVDAIEDNVLDGDLDVTIHGDLGEIGNNVVGGNVSVVSKKNPNKISSVRIEESPNKEKKMVAYFFDADGKKVRTTHFGARGMSDYTQHKDPKRMKRYLARHGKMGEDWKDPTTAGALSRWILWGKPSLRESFNDYKKKFNLEGVMTVTNTRMNPKITQGTVEFIGGEAKWNKRGMRPFAGQAAKEANDNLIAYGNGIDLIRRHAGNSPKPPYYVRGNGKKYYESWNKGKATYVTTHFLIRLFTRNIVTIGTLASEMKATLNKDTSTPKKELEREFKEMMAKHPNGVPTAGQYDELFNRAFTFVVNRKFFRNMWGNKVQVDKAANINMLTTYIPKKNPSENLTPNADEIREALDIFGEAQGLESDRAMLIAGAALYMHGLKPIMNDIDAIIPGMQKITEGYVNGLELDIGGGPDFTPEMLEYEVKDGVRYQTLPAILAFYKMLNREKDQVWISKLSSIIESRDNPRIPKKYEGQDPSEHSDLYTDEDPKGTIQGLGFKDKATAERSVNIIKRSGKTHAHKIQAAMAMEQRARFHPNATPGIKAAQKVYAKFIEEMKEKTKRNPKKTPEGRKIPKRYLKGLNKEEMLIAAKEIDKGYKYDIDDPKAYEYWKSDIKATARGYKTVPSKYKKKFIEMYGPLPEKGEFLDKMAKATKIKKSILQKVYDKGLAAWRGGHRPGVQQHQWAAGRVYSFVTLGNTVKKGNKKMPDYKLAIEAGLIKDNPPLYVHPDKAEKWSKRYDNIIKMSGLELMELAEKQAAEKGLTINLIVEDKKYRESKKQLKLPAKQQKLYEEYIESMDQVTISLSRGDKLIDDLAFTIVTQSPKKLVEYLTNRKIWRNETLGAPFLPRVGRVIKRGKTNRFELYESAMVATLQNKKRFPFAVAGSGGYEMSEGQKGKGYYGIIKTYQAGFLEANNMEQYGSGQSPMRVDLYQSYGWLSAYSYKDNYPYPSKAAEYYLNLEGRSKTPNKDADYWNIYRPVYSKKNPSEADFFPGDAKVAPYYMTAQTIPITALQNGGEWRHGEFAEDDPFEEYF